MLCGLLSSLAVGAVYGFDLRPGIFSQTIIGTVVDMAGQPIAGARVCASGTRPMAGRIPCTQSDLSGRFSIHIDQPDTYTISAEHLELGYPEAIWGFYGKLFANFPVVRVENSHKLPPVIVKLGPKAGRVVFKITDEVTNRPVDEGSITVCRVGEPLSCWSKSTAFPDGQYELLTPDAPFTVQFQTWKNRWINRAAFDQAGEPLEVIQVPLGARKEITVRLK